MPAPGSYPLSSLRGRKQRTYNLDNTQLQEIGREIVNYWESYDDDDPISGGDFVEFVGQTIESIQSTNA
jgi:hypothetical protein